MRFGRARRQVIVVQDRGAHLTVRMNAVFGEAPGEVALAVAKWMRNGRRSRRACERLDAWIAEVGPRLKPVRPARLRPQGERYDLSAILNELLRSEFARTELEGNAPGITWGRRSSSRPRRSLQLGSFDPETALIRIHPVLDQPAVPRFFVRYVVFHELLHAALEDEPAGPKGRRPHHGPRFRRAEHAYRDYTRALHWQEEHIAELLHSARTGRPMRPRGKGEKLVDPGAAVRQLLLF